MIYLCVRRDIDWSDETDVEARLREDLRPKVAVWNQTLTLPYHVFRQRLAAIAAESHAAVDGAAVATPDQVPPDGLIVPVDDHDWLAPDLGRRLEAARKPTYVGYHWRREILHVSRQRHQRHGLRPVARRRPDRHPCTSCNYAVVNRRGFETMIDSPGHAGDYFASNGSFVKELPRTLGVEHRSMASRSSLGPHRSGVTPAELLEGLELHRALYRRPRLGFRARWARPYVERMRALMDEIGAR
jgi:hypothetical protein